MFPSYLNLLLGLGNPYQQSGEPFGYGGPNAPSWMTSQPERDPYATRSFGAPYQPNLWERMTGALPQPMDVAVGMGWAQPPSAPVGNLGWGDVLDHFLPWRRPPEIPTPPPDFEYRPDLWPPGWVPYGPRG